MVVNTCTLKHHNPRVFHSWLAETSLLVTSGSTAIWGTGKTVHLLWRQQVRISTGFYVSSLRFLMTFFSRHATPDIKEGATHLFRILIYALHEHLSNQFDVTATTSAVQPSSLVDLRIFAITFNMQCVSIQSDLYSLCRLFNAFMRVQRCAFSMSYIGKMNASWMSFGTKPLILFD